MSGESGTATSDDWRSTVGNGEAQNQEYPAYLRLSSMTDVDSFVIEFDDDGEQVVKTAGDDEYQAVRFEVEVVDVDGRVLDSDSNPAIEGESYVLDVSQKSLLRDLVQIDDLEGESVSVTVDRSGDYAQYSAEVAE